MENRDERIVDAAIRVFSRYGVQRATMNDIASEAGLVRQTLYNAFANKEELLRAAIRLHTERALAATEAESGRADGLVAKLDIAFSHLIVAPFEQMRDTPHANEIVEGLRDAAKQEIAIKIERFESALAAFMSPHDQAVGAAGLTTKALASMILASWYGFSHKADTVEQLWQWQRSLMALVLILTDRGDR